MARVPRRRTPGPDADPCGTTRVRMRGALRGRVDRGRPGQACGRRPARGPARLRHAARARRAGAGRRRPAWARGGQGRAAQGVPGGDPAGARRRGHRGGRPRVADPDQRAQHAGARRPAPGRGRRGGAPRRPAQARADGRRGGRRTDQRRERRGRLPRGPRAARRVRGGPGQGQAGGGHRRGVHARVRGARRRAAGRGHGRARPTIRSIARCRRRRRPSRACR